MQTLNSTLHNYSNVYSSDLYSTPWSPHVDAPPSTDSAPRTTPTTEQTPEAYRYLTADRITYSGMRLVGNSMTANQLFALMRGAQATTPKHDSSDFASYTTYVPGLQAHILGHMSNPIIPQRSVRLPDNIASMAQAHSLADLARRLAAPQKPPVESSTTEHDSSLFTPESTTPSKEKAPYTNIINALASATPIAERSSAQYLGVAVPVKQTTVIKQNASESASAAAPRTVQRFPLVLPSLPDQFVSLACSATQA